MILRIDLYHSNSIVHIFSIFISNPVILSCSIPARQSKLRSWLGGANGEGPLILYGRKLGWDFLARGQDKAWWAGKPRWELLPPTSWRDSLSLPSCHSPSFSVSPWWLVCFQSLKYNSKCNLSLKAILSAILSLWSEWSGRQRGVCQGALCGNILSPVECLKF